MVPDDFNSFFDQYPKGIYNNVIGKFRGGHVVEIVGYSTDPIPHWIVKNSWGTTWADSGYFRWRAGIDLCNFESWVALTDVRGKFLRQPINTGPITLCDENKLLDLSDPENDEVKQVIQFTLAELNLTCDNKYYAYSDTELVYADTIITEGITYLVYFLATLPNTTCEQIQITSSVIVHKNNGTLTLLYAREEKSEEIAFSSEETGSNGNGTNNEENLNNKEIAALVLVGVGLAFTVLILVIVSILLIMNMRTWRNRGYQPFEVNN